jgi:hypothetical protein
MQGDPTRQPKRLCGRVFSGSNVSDAIVSDCADAIAHATGAHVVPGTLNVWLDGPIALDNRQAVQLDKPRLSFWPAAIDGLPVWIQRYDRGVLHVCELVADRRLRAALDLRDGDRVTLSIDPGLLVPIPWTGRAAWALFWRGRGRGSFVSRRYMLKARAWCRRLGATQDSVDLGSRRLLAAVISEALRALTARSTPQAPSR